MGNEKILMSMFCSMEKRNLLLLLQDGPQDKGKILRELEVSPQKLSPQLMELTQSKIIKHQDGRYELTAMGHLLVAEIGSLIETINFFDDDYWWDHNLKFIPSSLLRRLIKIKGWTRHSPDISKMYEHNREFHEKALLSSSVNVLTVVQPPFFYKWVYDILDSGGSLSVVFSVDLLNKMKKDNPEELQRLMSKKRFRLYTYPALRDLFYFLQCDTCVLLRPLTNDGTVDNIRLLNSNLEAVQVGRELFDYYLKDSTPVTEL